jgi:hypothetical protein
MVGSVFKTSAQLRLENLALRQQLAVLRRSAPKRLKLTSADRIFWAWLRLVWADWKSALLIVKADTVVAWHRKGFRLFWTWKIHRGKPGRPRVPKEVRDLIRMMSRNNPRWGAPRIHGELLKLGIDITEPTVAKYIVRHRKPPSQTWRTFLENHVNTLVVDFFVVPTIRFEILYVFLVLAHLLNSSIHCSSVKLLNVGSVAVIQGSSSRGKNAIPYCVEGAAESSRDAILTFAEFPQ